MSNLGRPRTRPPVRRITVEIDAHLLARVEEEGDRLNVSLREAVEAGLRLALQQMHLDRIVRYE